MSEAASAANAKRIMQLSSDFLTHETKAWLAVVRGNIRVEGGRVHLAGLMIGSADAGDLVPKDLALCMRLARSSEHDYIMFVDDEPKMALL